MKRIAVACLFLSVASATLSPATQKNPAMSGVESYDPLQHSHVVVHGRVTAVARESIVPGDLLNRGGDDRGIRFSVQVDRVELIVLSVLKGDFSQSSMSFVGLPNWRFEKGQELVVCAKWFKGRRMSGFVANTFLGLYERVGETGWVRCVDEMNVVRAERLTQNEMLARVSRASLSSIVAASDVIARGTIISEANSSYVLSDGRVGELTRFRLRILDQAKGKSADGILEFVVAKENTSYVPEWYRDVPRGIAEGQEWLVFLRSGERGLYPFGGPNSLLKVEGPKLIYDMAVTYPTDVDETTEKIREVVVNEE